MVGLIKRLLHIVLLMVTVASLVGADTIYAITKKDKKTIKKLNKDLDKLAGLQGKKKKTKKQKKTKKKKNASKNKKNKKAKKKTGKNKNKASKKKKKAATQRSKNKEKKKEEKNEAPKFAVLGASKLGEPVVAFREPVKGSPGTWVKVDPGSNPQLKIHRIAVGKDYNTVWGVDKENKDLYQLESLGWSLRAKGKGNGIAVGPDNTVVAIDNENKIGLLEDGEWKPFAQGLKSARIAIISKDEMLGTYKKDEKTYEIWVYKNKKWDKAKSADGKEAHGLYEIATTSGGAIMALSYKGEVYAKGLTNAAVVVEENKDSKDADVADVSSLIDEAVQKALEQAAQEEKTEVAQVVEDTKKVAQVAGETKPEDAAKQGGFAQQLIASTTKIVQHNEEKKKAFIAKLMETIQRNAQEAAVKKKMNLERGGFAAKIAQAARVAAEKAAEEKRAAISKVIEITQKAAQEAEAKKKQAKEMSAFFMSNILETVKQARQKAEEERKASFRKVIEAAKKAAQQTKTQQEDLMNRLLEALKKSK